MKYLIYAALLFIASLLFLPESGSTEIRNPEILMVIAAITGNQNTLESGRVLERNLKRMHLPKAMHQQQDQRRKHSGASTEKQCCVIPKKVSK